MAAPPPPTHSSFSTLPSTSPALFQSLESYPWSLDTEFQSGLTAILGPSTSSLADDQVRNLTLRARCYYYTRKFNQPIDFDAYVNWHQTHSRVPGEGLHVNEMPREEEQGNGEGMRTKTEDGAARGQNGQGDVQAPTLFSSEGSDELRDALRNSNNTATQTEIARSNGAPAPPIDSTEQPSLAEQAMRSPGFAEIARLIASGQDIPGIKSVPDTVMTGQGTQPSLTSRKKPWEVTEDEQRQGASDLARAFGRA